MNQKEWDKLPKRTRNRIHKAVRSKLGRSESIRIDQLINEYIISKDEKVV